MQLAVKPKEPKMRNVLVAGLFLLSACPNPPNPVVDQGGSMPPDADIVTHDGAIAGEDALSTSSPGQLELVRLGSPGNPPFPSPPSPRPFSPPPDPAPGVDGGVSITFDFGNIKGSDKFLLILQNSGGEPITDITITSSNPAFLVEPGSIDVLDVIGKQSIVPILSISVLHGTALQGVGYVPLLPMGDNESTLTVSGTTTDQTGGAVAVSVSATLKVFALVMAFQVSDADGVIDLSKGTSADSSYTFLDSIDPPAAISNIGNVDISVMQTDVTFSASTTVQNLTVSPGDTSAAITPLSIGNCGIPAGTAAVGWYLTLYGSGTVADYSLSPPTGAGTIRLAMQNCE